MNRFSNDINNDNDNLDLKAELLRYISFWPYFLLLSIFFVACSYIYLRYASYTYETTAIIEIIDEAQDSEMALPTELTVFNRSMINLENETNILNSFSLHSEVVKNINYNIEYYNVGKIKISETTSDDWFDDYELDFKTETDEIEKSSNYVFTFDDGKLSIDMFFGDDLHKSYSFNSLSTLFQEHQLPFDLTINSDSNFDNKRKLILSSSKAKANNMRNRLSIIELGKDSDQLSLTLTTQNIKLAENYLDGLLLAFDNDGIKDRQLEYNRTIEFVDEREKILKKQLELIEIRKQNFKQDNNLSDLTVDAKNNIDLKYSYNSETFEAESQKEIANFLLETLGNEEFDYLPLNIGLENFDLNRIINDYNLIVTQRNRYLNDAGPNNILVKSLKSQLENLEENISLSLQNYLNSLELKINNLKSKEIEFENVYNSVPENERTLRSIERELTIKEALYLLLLQKREEALINLAVVRPTIKIIDYPISNNTATYPKPRMFYLISFLLAIAIYVVVLYLWFLFDNKIHNKDQLAKKLNDNIPIICEIPFIKDKDALLVNSQSSLRSVLSESIRMLLSNLRFTSPQFDSNNKGKTMIFTSSIKSEGKTLASVNTSINLANDLKQDQKVILIGADLRNPQIHKNFNVERNIAGVSEIIYRNDHRNYKNYIKKFDNLDVLFSGSIPPNPTALLSSKTFEDLILTLKKDYDYIIIDSAPCLLVSDTYQIINYVDTVVYMFRSNFTDSKIIDYINDMYESKKIKNLNIVFNAVGNSVKYGYKYGYQYGYRYGYKYSYNYGYGYGYGEDNKG